MKTTLMTIAGLLIALAGLPSAHAAEAATGAPSLETLGSPSTDLPEPKPMACYIQPADANDDSDSTTKNTSVTIDVFSNDSGLGITSVGDPDHGTAEEGFNNTVIYTPDTGFTGTDSFVYSVNGCLQCNYDWCSEPDYDAATVTVTVTN